MYVLVLVVTFTGVEEPSNRDSEDFASDIKASSSRCVQALGLWIKLNYSPDPLRSAMMHGSSDGSFSLGSFSLAWVARNEALIGGILVLVGSASGTSKLRLGLLRFGLRLGLLRLGLLDENIERNFCLYHFLGDRSLFDMARGRFW